MIGVLVSAYAWRMRTLQEKMSLMVCVGLAVMVPLLAKFTVDEHPEIMVWVTAGMSIIFAWLGQLRPTEFDAVLPVPARDVFAARSIAAFGQALLPPAA